MSNGKRIAVLKGGWCAERDISLVSGAAAAKGLREAGYDVEEIDVSRRIADDLRTAFGGTRIDAVFNALHGPNGEDGRIQALLELMELPYTHSGVLSSALAMDKPKAKAVLRAAGLPVPGGKVIPTASLDGTDPLPRPYVLKPVGDGSSFGVHIVMEDSNFRPTAEALDDALFHGVAMIEPYIRGRELTTAVFGDRPLGVTEIVPRGAFYDFDSKYSAGGSTHVVPADVPAEITEACQRLAVEAAEALGCRGLSRTDFRWDDSQGVNGLFILEVNTQPGLTPTSLAPEQAAHAGISFEQLVTMMVEDASCPR